MKRLAFFLLAALALAGCASAPPLESAPAVRKPAYYLDDGPPDSVPDHVATLPDAVPQDEPYHRFANRPYTVFGKSYTPVVNNEPMKERGLASWYGKKFHGLKTASGEVYDMFKMTAAHKTLPIPSYARVTNVRTGQSIVVRVNDRGPFHDGRVIDLSYAAAQRLGIAQAGSGLVEVERVFKGQVMSAAVASDSAELWLQLGAFSSTESAEAFRARAAQGLPWLLEPLSINLLEGLYRVRLGPYRKREEALAIAEKVRESLGITAFVSGR